MIRAIASLKVPGTDEWSEVGMNYRTVFHKPTEKSVIYAARKWAAGRPCRVELFPRDDLLGDEPYATIIINGKNM
jgi:hypothetical protein